MLRGWPLGLGARLESRVRTGELSDHGNQGAGKPGALRRDSANSLIRLPGSLSVASSDCPCLILKQSNEYLLKKENLVKASKCRRENKSSQLRTATFASGACGLGNLCRGRCSRWDPPGIHCCVPLGPRWVLLTVGHRAPREQQERAEASSTHTQLLLRPSPAVSSRQMPFLFLCSSFLLWTRGIINLPDGSKHFTVPGLTTAGFLLGTSQAPGLLSLLFFTLQSLSSESLIRAWSGDR